MVKHVSPFSFFSRVKFSLTGWYPVAYLILPVILLPVLIFSFFTPMNPGAPVDHASYRGFGQSGDRGPPPNKPETPPNSLTTFLIGPLPTQFPPPPAFPGSFSLIQSASPVRPSAATAEMKKGYYTFVFEGFASPAVRCYSHGPSAVPGGATPEASPHVGGSQAKGSGGR